MSEVKLSARLFAEDGGCCYLLTDKYYLRYFCGTDISEGAVIVSARGVSCFTDARYFYQAKPALTAKGVTALLYDGLDSIKRYITDDNFTVVYLDYDTTTLRRYEEYEGLGKPLKDGSLNLKRLRAVKTADELSNIKRACEITQAAFYELLPELKEGVTELEIKDKLNASYLKRGASGESFDTIVAFGANSAVPHHKTGDTVLKRGMPVLIDTGCVVNGYCSDYTRTLYFGAPSERFINCYNAVLRANEAAINSITDGTPCNIADGYARNELEKSCLADRFTHSLGHGLGLEIHEYPTISPKRNDALENGTVFTVEPGVYFDGEFGIRIEDTVVLTDGRVKRLYDDKKDLIIL